MYNESEKKLTFFEVLKKRIFNWFRLKLFSISGKSLKQYFTVQRNLKWRFFSNLYIYLTLVYCPYLDKMYQNWVDQEPYHVYYIIFVCSLLNLFFVRFFFTLPGFSIIYDVKLMKLKLKNSTVYINLLVSELKKFLYFVFFYKFGNFFKSFFKYFNNFFSKFIFWRPLFKRFSYFGNFRLTNSKFTKN